MKIGIYGYGNLARGVENAISRNPDMELAAVFTRRDPASLKIATPGVPAVASAEVEQWQDKLDVLVLCGGSATDLPEMTPALAEKFHVIDSYDNHSQIPTHYAAVDAAAKRGGKLAMISCGWDPGLFSLNRMYAAAVLPDGKDYTFWGRGVSQGHSDAIRRIEGVLDARQYTIPVPEAMEAVRAGKNPELTTRQKHTRECWVALAPDADPEAVREKIVTMPGYFADYDTTVHFIPLEELHRDHGGLPHGGSVIRTGKTGKNDEHTQVIEYSLNLDSNPEFTGSVLAAYARAVCRMAAQGRTGCITVFDVAPIDLMAADREDCIAHML